MHLTILSRGMGVHTTRRLVEAANTLGYQSRVVDPVELQMGLGTVGPRVFWKDKPYGRTDVIIPRIAPSINAYGLALVNQFDISGVAVLNDAMAIAHSRNKMRLMQLLSRQGIPVPKTVIGRGALELKRMIALVGGYPVAIKLVRAQEKLGIIICETPQSLEAAVEAVLSMGHDIIVQRYVKPGDGRDLRALVVGGQVVAAVRRQPLAGRLQHSLSVGARVTRARLTPTQRHIAIESARVVGLEVAAIDLLALKSGETQVFEVNSSPGLREMEEATGDDLATLVIEHAAQLARNRRRLVALARAERTKRNAGRLAANTRSMRPTQQ